MPFWSPKTEQREPRTDKLSVDEKYRIRELQADGWGAGDIAEMLERSRPTIYGFLAEIKREQSRRQSKDPVGYRMQEIEAEALDGLMSDPHSRGALIAQVQDRLAQRFGLASPPDAAPPASLAEKIVNNLIQVCGPMLMMQLMGNNGQLDPNALAGMMRLMTGQPPPAPAVQVTEECPPDATRLAIAEQPAEPSSSDPADASSSADTSPAAGAQSDVREMREAIAFIHELVALRDDAGAPDFDAIAYRARIKIIEKPLIGKWLSTDGRLLQALAGSDALRNQIAPHPGGPELLAFIATPAGVQWWDTLRLMLQPSEVAA